MGRRGERGKGKHNDKGNPKTAGGGVKKKFATEGEG